MTAGRGGVTRTEFAVLVRMVRREPVTGFDVAFENDRVRVLAVAGSGAP